MLRGLPGGRALHRLYSVLASSSLLLHVSWGRRAGGLGVSLGNGNGWRTFFAYGLSGDTRKAGVTIRPSLSSDNSFVPPGLVDVTFNPWLAPGALVCRRSAAGG